MCLGLLYIVLIHLNCTRRSGNRLIRCVLHRQILASIPKTPNLTHTCHQHQFCVDFVLGNGQDPCLLGKAAHEPGSYPFVYGTPEPDNRLSIIRVMCALSPDHSINSRKHPTSYYTCQ